MPELKDKTTAKHDENVFVLATGYQFTRNDEGVILSGENLVDPITIPADEWNSLVQRMNRAN